MSLNKAMFSLKKYEWVVYLLLFSYWKSITNSQRKIIFRESRKGCAKLILESLRITHFTFYPDTTLILLLTISVKTSFRGSDNPILQQVTSSSTSPRRKIWNSRKCWVGMVSCVLVGWLTSCGVEGWFSLLWKPKKSDKRDICIMENIKRSNNQWNHQLNSRISNSSNYM